MPAKKDALNIELLISDQRWRELNDLDLEPLIHHAANAACAQVNIEPGKHELFEVSIKLSNDTEITDLNNRFRGKNKPTNVLSFPLEDDFAEPVPGPKPLGDIILAFETVAHEAKEQNKPLGHHIAHLVVHGVLHLLGYDHMDERQAAEMEGLECDILATLHIPSPYRS